MPTMPKLPTFELPKFELPDHRPQLVRAAGTADVRAPRAAAVEQLADAGRDAAYVGLGLAVMTVERLQAAGTQLAELVTAGVEQARAAATN